MALPADELAYRQYPTKLGGKFAVVQSGHVVDVVTPVIRLTQPRRRQKRPEQLQIKMSPGTGAYRHRRRRDASRAELATLQMVIGDADVDNVDTAWTTCVLRRDHSVKYSAELMRGSRVMHRRPEQLTSA